MGMILKVWNAASAAINGKMVLAATLSAAIRDGAGIVPVDRRLNTARENH